MSSMQNTMKARLNAYAFRTDTPSKPTLLQIGLFTTKPDKDGVGGVEVSGGDYARQDCGPLDENWSDLDVNGVSASLVDFTFAKPTADWGTVVAWGLWATVDGTPELWVVEDLAETKTITSNDLAPKFVAGDLTFTWS